MICNGDAIVKSQEKVCELLFKEDAPLLRFSYSQPVEQLSQFFNMRVSQLGGEDGVFVAGVYGDKTLFAAGNLHARLPAPDR